MSAAKQVRNTARPDFFVEISSGVAVIPTEIQIITSSYSRDVIHFLLSSKLREWIFEKLLAFGWTINCFKKAVNIIDYNNIKISKIFKHSDWKYFHWKK